eukprot:9413870-Pyramimonas_sp.AAC.1
MPPFVARNQVGKALELKMVKTSKRVSCDPASLRGSSELSSASSTRGPPSMPCEPPGPWASTSARTGE